LTHQLKDIGMAKPKIQQKSKKKKKITKVSHLRKPEDMNLQQWQVALRKEFGGTQNFRLKNTGEEPVFSEYSVFNPQTKRQYRVAIRGENCGDNFCSCPDFAVNTLGTCKHIEFTLAKLRRQRGGAKILARGFSPAYSEIYVRYGAKRQVVFKAGTGCPQSLVKLTGKYFDKDGILLPQSYLRFEDFLKAAHASKHDLRCYEDTLAFIAEIRDRHILAKRIDKLFPGGIKSKAFSNLLKVSLYPYQRQGALFTAKAGRSLLADDMGLGKTIQAIAAVEILVNAVGVERVLIICPTSLKHQWKQEIEKFSPRNALVVEGLLSQRTMRYASDSFYKITNYDVVFRDSDLLCRWNPDVIILDEAQRIKNWKTRTAKSVKKLESKYTIVLTGTPLENRLEELHSIVEFVDRFRLGPMFNFLAQHQHVDEHGKVIGYRDLSKISKTLEPILLRRNKNEVLTELPERLEKNYFVPMTSQQMQHHEENREIVSRIVAKWRRYKFLTEADQRRLMIALQNMRMSCDSTYLLDKKTDFGVKADEVMTVLDEIFETPETKVVIFSQWLRMHELLRQRLEAAKHRHILFHGGIPGAQRKKVIQQFKEDDRCRLFLSTDAGGVGLNLQNASAVINMDMPWNPAVLDQRIGRVHRLGQHRPVRVVNFVAQGTIEHGMLSLLSFKKSLFAGILEDGQDEVFLGGTRLNRFMDSVEKATGGIPATMPQQNGSERNGDGQEQQAASGAEAEKTPQIVLQQNWNELVSAGLSFLDKLGQTFLGPDSQHEPISKAFSGVKLEEDKTTGQRHLKLPMPSKEILKGIAELLTEFSKKM
jgi:superfamily II DNA or RNA helicase